jgi:hypothetical protein
VAPGNRRLDVAQIDRLAKRAQAQLTGLRAQHRRAAREAFADR